MYNETEELSMNWIILVVAGLFESGFAFCLGKMKGVTGTEYYLWGAGFLVCLAISMLLLAKAVHTLPIGTGLSRVDGDRCGKYGNIGDCIL